MSQLQTVTRNLVQIGGPMILVEEISHRVVNEYAQAIAGIRLAAARTTSAEARQTLMQAATRLRCFAEAHRALLPPRSAESVDLGEYLARLCAAKMAAGLQERGVRLTLLCDTVRLGCERCWWVALIVSELITNSMRHGLRGGPGAVTIALEAIGDIVNCRVCDDGRADRSAQPARGLSVVMGLAGELGGHVRWSFNSLGTTAELTFPGDSVRSRP